MRFKNNLKSQNPTILACLHSPSICYFSLISLFSLPSSSFFPTHFVCFLVLFLSLPSHFIRISQLRFAHPTFHSFSSILSFFTHSSSSFLYQPSPSHFSVLPRDPSTLKSAYTNSVWVKNIIAFIRNIIMLQSILSDGNS